MKLLMWIKSQVYYKQINWELLLFLILFLHVKLWVKVLSVLLTCFLNRKNLFPVKTFENQLSWFYLLIIILAIVNVFLQPGNISTNYLVAVGTGILFWMLAAFASYQCFRFVKNSTPASIHVTITVFFLLNVIITFLTFGKIIIETGTINPYTYQGLYQKYFITTGDYLRGISFDTSTTNAFLNCFAIVYFISRKKVLFTFLCMAAVLLTGSNFTNFLLAATLGYMFVFRSDREQKSVMAICLMFLVIFMAKISPQNNKYVQETFRRILKKDSIRPATSPADIVIKPDSLLSPGERKQKFARLYLDSMARLALEQKRAAEEKQPVISVAMPLQPELLLVKPSVPKDDIHSKPFQRRRDTTVLQKELITFIKKDRAEDSIIASNKEGKRIPGKLLAFRQTLDHFKTHPIKVFTGTGIGNFSSKLAFRTTGLNIAGGYPARFIYINKAFSANHLAVFLYYFSKDAQLHSIINTPNSVYDQLLSEYGLAGIMVFLLMYVAYFIRNIKLLTFGMPLLLIMLGGFFADYWFEQLSIIVLFELMMFLDIRENKLKLHG